MTKIRIVQALCGPKRDCILALAFDKQDEGDMIEALQKLLEIGIQTRGLNPRCGICGSTSGNWIYEVATTKFTEWEPALAALEQLEKEQQRTAETLKRLGLSYDGLDAAKN